VAGSGDSPFGKLGLFINGNITVGSRDETENEAGFDFDIGGITFGGDYRFTDNFILGGAFNYFHTDADFDDSAGDADSDAYSGSLFGTYYFSDQFYVDAIGTYGSIDYDMKRKIRYSIPSQNEFVNTTAEGNPDGDIRSFFLGAGYNFFWNEFTVTPYLGAEYIKLEVDAYREKQQEEYKKTLQK